MKIAALILATLFFAQAIVCAQDSGMAKQFYEKVVKLRPDDANANFDLGNIYLREKHYDDALKCYEAVGKTGLARLRMSKYYFNLGVCYTGLGRIDDAVSSLEKSVKIDPGFKEANDLLALYKDRASMQKEKKY